MKLPKYILRLLATTCLVAASTPVLQAQAQTDLTTPTQWAWLTNATLAQVTAQVNLGYRVVDIEIEDDSPLTLSASFVRNTGVYAKSWWWYIGLTHSAVNSRISQNNARLIDVEPYQTPNGIRYAVLMIANTGSDFATSHGWDFNMTGNQVNSWVTANPTRRILDLQVYNNGANTSYAFVWITNTGVHQTPWWYYMNTSIAVINNFLSQNNVRMIDLERTTQGGGYSAVLVPGDGKSTYHLIGLTFNQLIQNLSQFSSRLIDIERHEVSNGPRFSVVMRPNNNDLAIAANNAMRSHIPLSATSGLSLVRIDNGFNPLAGVQEDRIFEPASLIKTAHLFTAIRRVNLGLDILTGLMTVNTGLNGSCPNGTAPMVTSVQGALQLMMEQSSNAHAEAIRARYGTSTIESYCANVGAGGIQLNHTLGCLCGSSRNQATLNDFARIHRSVAVGGVGPYKDTFHERMINGASFGGGIYDTRAIMNAEIAASNLTSAEEAAFRNGLKFAHKGGSYTCGSGSENHRSIGAYVRVPYRNNCNTIFREYFIGAWVNDAPNGTDAGNAQGAGMATLWTDILRDALSSWDSANCVPFINYCPTVPNSTGVSSMASASGNQYVLSNDFTMGASDMPQNVFTFMLVGTTDQFQANPGGSLGNLCIGGSIGRYWDSLQSTGNSGTATHATDLQAIPRPNGAPIPVQAGQTLYFQWWHRDTVGGAPASNFTDGLRVTFI